MSGLSPKSMSVFTCGELLIFNVVVVVGFFFFKCPHFCRTISVGENHLHVVRASKVDRFSLSKSAVKTTAFKHKHLPLSVKKKSENRKGRLNTEIVFFFAAKCRTIFVT